MDASTERLVRLVVGDIALTIDLDSGARATSWTVAGTELLAHHGDDPVEHGMYPMAPWAGRVRGNAVTVAGTTTLLPVTYAPWALHGTVLARSGSVVREEHSSEEARLVVRFTDHPGWPWATTVDVDWHLQPGRLTTRLSVQADADAFPAVVGWHPWFRRDLGVGAPLQWRLSATSRLVRGDDHLPTGDLVAYDPADGPFDDAFVATDASVEWPGALRIDIASDGGWFVVFDELSDAVCVEPQSGPPDGLRERAGAPPRRVVPGEPLMLTTQWSISGGRPGDPV